MARRRITTSRSVSVSALPSRGLPPPPSRRSTRRSASGISMILASSVSSGETSSTPSIESGWASAIAVPYGSCSLPATDSSTLVRSSADRPLDAVRQNDSGACSSRRTSSRANLVGRRKSISCTRDWRGPYSGREVRKGVPAGGAAAGVGPLGCRARVSLLCVHCSSLLAGQGGSLVLDAQMKGWDGALADADRRQLPAGGLELVARGVLDERVGDQGKQPGVGLLGRRGVVDGLPEEAVDRLALGQRRVHDRVAARLVGADRDQVPLRAQRGHPPAET